MSGEPSLGPVSTPSPAPDAGASAGVWGSLREVGGWWGVLRLLPAAVRQVFSGREPVGGLPIVEPGQTWRTRLPEIDVDPGAPTADHTPAAQAHTAEPLGAESTTVDASLADSATAEAAVVEPPAAEVVPEVTAEPRTADVTEVSVSPAAVSEACAELGEVGLEAGL